MTNSKRVAVPTRTFKEIIHLVRLSFSRYCPMENGGRGVRTQDVPLSSYWSGEIHFNSSYSKKSFIFFSEYFTEAVKGSYTNHHISYTVRHFWAPMWRRWRRAALKNSPPPSSPSPLPHRRTRQRRPPPSWGGSGPPSFWIRWRPDWWTGFWRRAAGPPDWAAQGAACRRTQRPTGPCTLSGFQPIIDFLGRI